jgi:hypothetical protein
MLRRSRWTVTGADDSDAYGVELRDHKRKSQSQCEKDSELPAAPKSRIFGFSAEAKIGHRTIPTKINREDLHDADVVEELQHSPGPSHR